MWLVEFQGHGSPDIAAMFFQLAQVPLKVERLKNGCEYFKFPIQVIILFFDKRNIFCLFEDHISIYWPVRMHDFDSKLAQKTLKDIATEID